MTVIDIAMRFIAYSMILFIFVCVCYVWGYVLCSGYRFIKNEVIPVIFLKDDPDDRWD